MTKIVNDSVNNVFGIKEEMNDRDVTAIYDKPKVNAHINSLIDFVIRGLCKLNKPFKYCVSGVLMQNNGASLNTCCKASLYLALAYQDSNNDGAVTVNRVIGDNVIVLTVFAMQIWYLFI